MKIIHHISGWLIKKKTLHSSGWTFAVDKKYLDLFVEFSDVHIIISLVSHRVSKSHGLTVVRPRKNFQTLRKIWRFGCAYKKCMHFNLFLHFFFIFYTYYVFFCDIFPFFLAQNVKNKVLTAQKILLLECLVSQQ